MPKRLRKPGPDAADVKERSFVVCAHDEGPERVLPLSLAGRDAGNHTIEGRLLLDLDPILAPLPRAVSGVASLRDDPFEPSREDRVVVVDPTGLDVIAHDDAIVFLQDFLQKGLPLHLGL